MPRAPAFIAALAFFAFVAWVNSARADMGPCVPAVFDLICGNGPGAARVIVKTISPSKRLAFAWRLAKRPPGAIPNDNADDLENFVIRIADGAILAKSHGTYWDLSTKIAKAFLMATWSPDSRLLFRVEQSAKSSSAELYFFGDADKAIGPLELVKVIESALQEKMQESKASNNSVLLFNSHPAITVDDQGSIHATAFIATPNGPDGPTYEIVVRALHTGDALDAKVVSATPFGGVGISIIVH